MTEPRSRLKMIALIASIGGAMAFTVLGAAFGWVLWRGGWPAVTAAARVDWIGWGMMAFAAGAIVAMLSLGFVITPRRFRIGKDGLEGSGGETGDDQDAG